MQKTTWKADDFSYVIHLTGYVFAMFAGADTPFKKVRVVTTVRFALR